MSTFRLSSLAGLLIVLRISGLGTSALAQTYTTISAPSAQVTYATGISGSSIAGAIRNDNSSSTAQYFDGFVYNGSTWTTFDDPQAYVGRTNANAISGSTIVGTYSGPKGDYGFIYSAGTFTNITAGPNAETSPTGVSGNIVVGTYINSSGNHGFVYNGSTVTTINDPSASNSLQLTVNGTWPSAVSGSTVVGNYYDAAGNDHGFVYNGSTWTTMDDPLATNGTYCLGISGSTIVGYFGDSSGFHGFIYDGSSWATLDDPDAMGGNTEIYGISGDTLVGQYQDPAGDNFSFIATVPEPGPLPLLTFGLVGLLRRQH